MNEVEHLLTCLAEECAEVQQRVTKALRFGLDECEPPVHPSNADRVVYELLDLLAVVEMLEQRGILPVCSYDESVKARLKKQRKVEKFMRYAIECGTLQTSTNT